MKRIALGLISLCLACTAFAQVDLVMVDKSARKMMLMDNGKVIKTYRIALGANPKGHKQQEGDQRTPEGRYILDYKNEQSSFYRSMHISYPNRQDKAVARKSGVSPGGMIMVHGQNKQFAWASGVTQYLDWTAGCIAITNDEMDEFMALVRVGTPIEINW